MRASDIPYGILVPDITTDGIEEALFRARRQKEPVLVAMPANVDKRRALWRLRSAVRRCLGDVETTKWQIRTSRDQKYLVMTRR